MFTIVAGVGFFLAFFLGQFGRWQFGGGVSVTLLDIVVGGFVFGSLIFLLSKGRFWEVVLTRPAKPLVFFFFACLVSLLVNMSWLRPDELSVSVLYLIRFFVYSSLLLVIPFFSKKTQLRLLYAIASAVLFAVGIGFIQFFYYPNLHNLFYLGWDDHLYRLFSVYLDPNFASVIFACLFFYLLWQLMRMKIGLRRIVLGVFGLLTVIAVFLTYSRTGMLTLAVGTVVYLVMSGYKKFLFACLGLFLFLLLITSDVKIEGLNPFRTATASARFDSMKIGLAIFQKNPVFGVGFNAYRYAQHRYGFRPGGAWETSHADSGTDNSFLFVLATTGVVGLLAYLYFWYSLIIDILRRRGKSDSFSSVVLATFAGVFVSSFFLNTLFYPFILIWLMLLYSIRESTSP
ncbi:MAG: O-antigen ligase family protein [bacterium]|nr:O-antigen ligase family protein [bacterium]